MILVLFLEENVRNTFCCNVVLKVARPLKKQKQAQNLFELPTHMFDDDS